MNPDQLIAHLDAFLERAGEDAVLRRGASDVTVRVAQRIKDRPDELVSGNVMDDLLLVTSMTNIRAASWQAGTVDGRDTALPRRGDIVLLKGVRYRVDAADPIAVQNVVVRVNLNLKGGASGA